MPLSWFHPAVARWFTATFPGGATAPQSLAWPRIRSGQPTLIAAPTGSGKTLAAFLAAIDDLCCRAARGELLDLTAVVYVSPLKALANDIRKNLEEPLAGIAAACAELVLPMPEIRSGVRTGDTPARERTAMLRRPPHLLVTTPESLYILLTSAGGRRMLRTARTVIVDEIHAVVGDKRGAHLALSLERLAALCAEEGSGEPQRIGLSATQKPIAEVARFLVGGRRANDAKATARGPECAPAEDPAETCAIIDVGHRRALDLGIEVPGSPLEAVMSAEVWEEVYDRLATLAREHRSTLVFTNARRLSERVAHHLSQRLGADVVAAHHGSLSRERRLDAETRLKNGQLRVLVATASLELGIDIGAIDLVCQLGSTRAISALLQRVGRSGHRLGDLPKGRLFPLSRDELLECVALCDAVRLGELEELRIPRQPLDILAQQIVAEVSAREWGEDELFAVVRRAWPYRDLARAEFEEVVAMLSDGFTTRRGRRGAYLHRDGVHGRLHARRGARLAAITSGGAIPDSGDFQVILEPSSVVVGTVNEDFAIESIPGEVFQLGNASWRITKIESGRVLVEDARGAPPTLPFWLGEAPERSPELSVAVCRLRREVAERLTGCDAVGAGASLARGNAVPEISVALPDVPPTPLVGEKAAREGGGSSVSLTPNPPPTRREGDWLLPPPEARRAIAAAFATERSLPLAVAEQIVEYLAATVAALGVMPTQETLVLERFFDEAGDTHVVLHAPFGSRINRAWGLALRKRFCRSFNFELQAAATENALLFSLGPTHSFPLADVFRFLTAATVRDLLVQAMLDAPVFGVRWRWNASRALALLRFRSGRRVPPRLQRQEADDLSAVVFPHHLACPENLAGEREIPDHPLVRQTVQDCLTEAMDVEGLEALLRSIAVGERRLIARELTEPSPFAHEIVNARVYAFLDDAPLEERRTQAVQARRFLSAEDAAGLGALDLAAIEAVRQETFPEIESAEELHDALGVHGFLTVSEIRRCGERVCSWLLELERSGRALTAPLPHLEGLSPGGAALLDTDPCKPLSTPLGAVPPTPEENSGSAPFWYATERSPQIHALLPSAPRIRAQQRGAPTGQTWPFEALPGARVWAADEALIEILRGRLELLGPVTAEALGAPLAGSLETTSAGESCPAPAVTAGAIETALTALEGQGFVFRGRFTPGVEETEWCARALLARIHRRTLDRLRREIEPVSKAAFVRFLAGWQHALPSERVSGPEGLAGILDQLEGFEAPAAAWESEILPTRVAHYDPAWLDALCLSGRYGWLRLSGAQAPAVATQPGGVVRRSGPVRATPIALVRREHLGRWREVGSGANGRTETPVTTAQGTAVSESAGPMLSADATAVAAHLGARGACFFAEIAAVTRLLASQLEAALAELVASGLVTSDSFAGLRALLLPARRRAVLAAAEHRRPGIVPRLDSRHGMEGAGRWSLLREPPLPAAAAGTENPVPAWQRSEEIAEAVARALLRRYGVLTRRLLDGEGRLPPWRSLLAVLRRLEARGEVRAGRFLGGVSGEQYALPDAVARLRAVRRSELRGDLLSVSAVDPLCAAGLLATEARVATLTSNRVIYRDGEAVAVLEAGVPRFLVALDPAAAWEVETTLRRQGAGARRERLERSA